MNIFVLDKDVYMCARYHNDKHCVKMILESAQMLCTIANELGVSSPYKSTHKHHPSTIWAGSSKDNYIWLYNLMLQLNKEWKFRFNHTDDHLSVTKFKANVDVHSVLDKLSDDGLTEFALAMPDHFKSDDAVSSYREYYRVDKAELHKYTKRNKPEWL